MKQIISLITAVLFFISGANIHAQDKFHFGINGGYVFQGLSEGIFNAGKNAWAVRLNSSYSLISGLRINLLTGYYNFPNYKNYSGIIALTTDVVLPGDAYNISTIDRTNAKVYQIGIGITLADYKKSSVFPFFSVYSGIYIFDYVKNHYPSYWLWDRKVVLPPYVQSTKLTKGFLSLGLGFQIPFAAKFALNLQGIYSLTFDRSNRTQHFIPVLLGFEYSF